MKGARVITYKALSTADVDLFESYPYASSPEVGLEHRIKPRAYLADGHYRPEWMWVALDDGVAVARMAFWSFPDDDEPKCVDWFEIGERDDRVAIGGELMRRAYAAVHKGPELRPSYLLFAPAEWRGRDGARELITERIAAAEAAGLSVFVERHGLRWTPENGLPERPAHLTFAEADDDAFVAAVAESYTGTLDAYSGDGTGRNGAHATAAEEVGDMLKYPRGRDWWRLAHDAEGSLVGAIFPADNGGSPVIGYIAVMPGHRGKGHVHALLAEMMHVLVDQGAEKITANTDLANVPMKAAFDRAGFVTNSCRIDLR